MIRYFVGVPGSGKTTLACRLLMKNIKPFIKLSKNPYKYNFANFDNKLANVIDLSLLATQKLPPGSYLAIDESGIEFNARGFKSLPMGFIEFFKMHRHEHCDIDIFSQTWDDTDKQIRDLASEIWLIKKVGPLSYARCVYKRVGIDEVTHQLQYQHYFRSVFMQLLPFMPKQFIFCWRPSYYRYFDSFAPMNRPVLARDVKGKAFEPIDTFSIAR